MKRIAVLLALASCMAAMPATAAESAVPLVHARPAWATARNDLGEVDPALQLSHLTIVLNRSPERQAAFETLLREQQDPRSPSFHRWLTPTRLGEEFGATDADVAQVSAWLRSQGLHVDRVANSRVRVEFSGPAASVAAAFRAPLHAYLVDGDRRIAPTAAPQVPASISRSVAAVFGLHTMRARPRYQVSPPRVAMGAEADPDLSSCSGTTCVHYVAPADFATIYDVNGAYQQGITGAGRTLAVVGRARVYLPDIENFQRLAGLAIKDPVITVPPNGIDPGPAQSTSTSGTPVFGDQGEATLDVSRAASVAPGATVDLVISANSATTGGVEIAAEYVIDSATADIVTMSFDVCENSAGPSGAAFLDNLFGQAAAEGISLFASSGDSGVAGCDKHPDAPPANQFASPNALCSSGYVTCVGGTELADSANPSAYWTTNSPKLGSALGYIPEGAWNDPLDSAGNVQSSASGGGVSAFIPTPTWQTGPGVPGTQGRYTPDVSFSASSHDGYFGCFAAGGGSCVAGANGRYTFLAFAGTSASAPSMAGIAALLDQKMGAAQGNLNPRLYALAAAASNGVFHDITAATSGVFDCTPDTPSLCNNSMPGPSSLADGLAGYVVGPGYDMVTGLGSIDVGNLLSQWSTTIPTSSNAPGPLSGLWYNANESGWGIAFTQRRNILFAAWYTYDGAGNPTWYVMPSCTLPSAAASGSCTGTLYHTTGPVFFGATFDPSRVGSSIVGSLTVSFQNGNAATMSYSVNGQGRTVAIARQVFQSGSVAPPVDYTDLWWNPNESGWGVDITHQYGVMFIAWFVYDGAGKPMWYVAPDCVVAGAGCSGTLYSTTGPPLGPTFDPAQVQAFTAGNVSVTFTDASNGTLSYSVNGVFGTKAITRQLF